MPLMKKRIWKIKFLNKLKFIELKRSKNLAFCAIKSVLKIFYLELQVEVQVEHSKK